MKPLPIVYKRTVDLILSWNFSRVEFHQQWAKIVISEKTNAEKGAYQSGFFDATRIMKLLICGF